MIKNIYYSSIFSLFICFFLTPVFAQEVTPSAKFDVIIKKDGSIIYGLVQEVGLLEIKYKRTDIPDGPIYSIIRNEVYAISYRNQVKEYLAPINESVFLSLNGNKTDTIPSMLSKLDFNDQEFRLQVGFFRGYSKLDQRSSYTSELSLIPITIAYDVAVKSNLRIGVSLGFASYNFKKNEFNTYDSTQLINDVKENQFAVSLYLKKQFGSATAKLKPFVLFGAGINSSLIQSSSVVSLSNDSGRKLLISSEGRSTSLGIQLRAGLDYSLSEKIKISTDLGSGIAVLQFGFIVKI